MIYWPEAERWSRSVKAVLSEQFDAFVWFEETRPVTPRPNARPRGVPDTNGPGQ